MSEVTITFSSPANAVTASSQVASARAAAATILANQGQDIDTPAVQVSGAVVSLGSRAGSCGVPLSLGEVFIIGGLLAVKAGQ